MIGLNIFDGQCEWRSGDNEVFGRTKSYYKSLRISVQYCEVFNELFYLTKSYYAIGSTYARGMTNLVIVEIYHHRSRHQTFE